MFKTILLPTDGSALSERTIPTALDFAKLTGGKIVGICVIQPLPYTGITDTGLTMDAAGYEEGNRHASEQHVKKLAAAALAAGVPFEGVVVTGVSAHEEIAEAAKKFQCDLIIMGSHGRSGLTKLLLGSETEKVLGHTDIPVLVLH